MEKKTVLAGETSYAAESAIKAFGFAVMGVLFYIFAIQQAAKNEMGIYLLEILPNMVAVVFGILFGVYLIKFLTELQFATFSDRGIAFRSVLFKLGFIKWDELVAVRYQTITIRVRKRYGRYSRMVDEPKTFVVLQTKEYRRAPQGRFNAKYGEFLRIVPVTADCTVASFLEQYRPDLKIECYE